MELERNPGAPLYPVLSIFMTNTIRKIEPEALKIAIISKEVTLNVFIYTLVICK